MTRLAGALPKDSAHNGLGAIERQLIAAEDGDEFTLVVRVETAFLKINNHTGESEALLAILDVQPVLPGDLEVADRLLRAARQAHTGQSELELDGLKVTKGTGEVIDSPVELDARLRAAGDHTLDDDGDPDDDEDAR